MKHLTTFASRLEAARTACGLSKGKAARAADVTDETWRSWESGDTSPPVNRLPELAGILGCRVSDLMPLDERRA